MPQGLSPRQFQNLSAKVRAEVSALGLGDDIFVQGSRSAGTAKIGSDFDFGIRVSPQKFDELLVKSFGNPIDNATSRSLAIRREMVEYSLGRQV